MAALALGSLLVGLPAAHAAVSATVSGGVLTITGDGADDTILVTCAGGQAKVNGNDPSPAAACATITTISINSGAGDDTVSLATVTLANFTLLSSTTINGGPGRDQITGGTEADMMIGGPDDDTFRPGFGNDAIQGGGSLEGDFVEETIQTTATLTDTSLTSSLAGTDTLNDVETARLTGGGLADTIDASGFSGQTDLLGLGGTDTITGGSGPDEILGGTQVDALDGGPGSDRFSFEPGNDTIVGGTGDDYLQVLSIAGTATLTDTSFALGGETDTLSSIGHVGLYSDDGGRTINASAYSGNVLMYGGAGNDVLSTGSGDDVIGAGEGVNSINAGSGRDRLDVSTDDPSTILSAGTLVSASTDSSFTGVEMAQAYLVSNDQSFDARDFLGGLYIDGSFGNDTILGGVGKSKILGDDGDDILKGFGGPDRIFGNAGMDTIVGGKQKDRCTGGAGPDTFKSCEVTKP